MKNIDIKRIQKYFNASSEKDSVYLENAFLDKENETELKNIALSHWKEASDKHVNLQHILNRIHFNINSQYDETLSHKLIRVYSRVAAILFIPLLIVGTLFWMFSGINQLTYTELTAPKGSRVQFTLPDGSTGHLNSGSTIRYASNFSTSRNLELRGEGYFHVTKDLHSPFVVETQYANIKVHGTEFDVCAYESDQDIVTTLENGSVEVFSKSTNASTLLVPGEQNRLDKASGTMNTIKVNTAIYTSWKDELLRFNNAPFAEVIQKMERWYGVKISLDKCLLYSESYTMTIKTESLRETLQLLQLTIPMEYEIENDQVYIKKRGTK